MDDLQRSIYITDRSSAGEARRVAMSAAQALGFTEDQRSNIGIVATEAANNIVLHAREGELLLCSQKGPSGATLDLLALDKGPGIRDVPRALEDGFSTAGTAGHGMGAMGRLSASFSLYSAPDRGTALLSRFRLHPGGADRSFAAISIPIRGETKCGDGYIALPGSSRSVYMVVDGLGHGAGANEAAEEAKAVLRAHAQESPSEILARAHDALKKTRGAAMSVAAVDHERSVVSYAGVGNISASLVNGGTARSMVSQNGTLGVVLPRLQEYTYPCEAGTLLLMFSDGLSSRCSLSGYPGLRTRPLPLIAGVLYRDFSRRRDDATVMVARLMGASH